MHSASNVDNSRLQVPTKGLERRISGPHLPEDGSLSTDRAHLDASGPNLLPSLFGAANVPATVPILQGASHFGIDQVNVDHRIGKLNVVTTINNYGGSTCACGTSSSQVVTTVNTPGHQLRFEFNQREGRHEGAVRLQESNSTMSQLVRHAASPEPCEADACAKERGLEELTAAGDLTFIFGEERSRGIAGILRDFALYQRESGAKNGRLFRLHAHFVPHYNGLSRVEMKRLKESAKVAVARVVKGLHTAQRCSHRPLTFEAIRATLAQLILLEPRPERNTILRRAVKISEGAPLPEFLTESKWVMELIESDVPESVLDSRVTSLVSKKRSKGGVRKMCFGDQAHGWIEGQIHLVDLTVLTFPRLDVPQFKLSRLLLRCDISKRAGTLSTKRRANVVLEYLTHSYSLREGTIVGISPEARNRDCAYAYGLFLS